MGLDGPADCRSNESNGLVDDHGWEYHLSDTGPLPWRIDPCTRTWGQPVDPHSHRRFGHRLGERNHRLSFADGAVLWCAAGAECRRAQWNVDANDIVPVDFWPLDSSTSLSLKKSTTTSARIVIFSTLLSCYFIWTTVMYELFGTEGVLLLLNM